jgi:hypothetical protein
VLIVAGLAFFVVMAQIELKSETKLWALEQIFGLGTKK